MRPTASRREFLWRSGGGLGGLALAHLLGTEGLLGSETSRPEFEGGLHHRARAKRVVQLFMSGAASQCDTFDYKPLLIKKNGQAFDPGGKVELFQSSPGAVMKSPWGWRRHGGSGKFMSDLVPHLAGCVDDMAFVHSVVSKSNVHGPATFMQNTGFVLPGVPGDGGVGGLRAGEPEREPPHVRGPARLPRVRPQRTEQLGGGFPARVVPGDDGQAVVARAHLSTSSRPSRPGSRPKASARDSPCSTP